MKKTAYLFLIIFSFSLFARSIIAADTELGFYYDAISEQNFPEKLLELAEDGSVEAQFYMGKFFSNSETNFKDFHQALFWYLKAAEKNHIDAIREVAVFYSAGIGGVERACDISIEFYQKQFDLGATYIWDSLAWQLVTCEKPTARNPKKAMNLVNQFLHTEELSVGKLDTVAAVYASNGFFSEAIAYQELVVKIITQLDEHPDRVSKMKQRLSLYRENKTWFGWSYERPDLYQ